MIAIYIPFDILHLSYRTLVFENLKVQAHEKATLEKIRWPWDPTDWKRSVFVKHSTADEYDDVYWRRHAYTAKEWTADTLTTCGAADVTIMAETYIQPQSARTPKGRSTIPDWFDVKVGELSPRSWTNHTCKGANTPSNRRIR
ncbi:LOW QUALITY PROTEIN: hypothetical protein IFM47457_00202 [Aspergillus lentulus]|nr:LOW QUALITY PROTEIN: hypothetical protein IFM47457_00202 [Aspergillus lentulus]